MEKHARNLLRPSMFSTNYVVEVGCPRWAEAARGNVYGAWVSQQRTSAHLCASCSSEKKPTIAV